MKRTFLIIYITIFLTVSILPMVLTPFGIGLAGHEKRQLAQLPVLFSDSGFNSKFTDQFNDYFNDNFGLRNYMIQAWSVISYHFLGTSASRKALAGKEGWLYLSDTIDSYSNKNTLTDEQINRIAGELLKIQQMVQESGGKFVFSVAPDKNSIYPEYMPGNIVVFDAPDNYDKLTSLLDKLGVNHTDLKATLIYQKNSGQLYHKWDTHWNGWGAWLAYNEILNCVNLNAGLSVTDFKNSNDWPGDLLSIVLPGSKKMDEQMYPSMDIVYSFSKPGSKVDDVDITTTTGVNNQRVLVFRDSFTNQLLQYFSNSFGYARYLRGTPYDLSMIEQEAPDLVIIEIAERNIPELLNNLDIAD